MRWNRNRKEGCLIHCKRYSRESRYSTSIAPAHHADKNIAWKIISGNNQRPTRVALAAVFTLTSGGAYHIAMYLALVRVKRKQCTFLNSNKRHSKWLLLKPGHQWRMPYRYIFGLGMSQEERVNLFEFEQASFEMTYTETWGSRLLCDCWLFPSVSPQPITITSAPIAVSLESKFNRTQLFVQPAVV